MSSELPWGLGRGAEYDRHTSNVHNRCMGCQQQVARTTPPRPCPAARSLGDGNLDARWAHGAANRRQLTFPIGLRRQEALPTPMQRTQVNGADGPPRPSDVLYISPPIAHNPSAPTRGLGTRMRLTQRPPRLRPHCLQRSSPVGRGPRSGLRRSARHVVRTTDPIRCAARC